MDPWQAVHSVFCSLILFREIARVPCPFIASLALMDKFIKSWLSCDAFISTGGSPTSISVVILMLVGSVERRSLVFSSSKA